MGKRNAHLIKAAEEANSCGDRVEMRRLVAELRASQDACPHREIANVKIMGASGVEAVRYCRDCSKVFEHLPAIQVLS